jgi:hypothetical protein
VVFLMLQASELAAVMAANTRNCDITADETEAIARHYYKTAPKLNYL